ncbi:MAG: hypothetical protein HYZ20_18225 [Burkholderiales bacterium]|nr:hypothetical protein [Burkholderiales bacterium]
MVQRLSMDLCPACEVLNAPDARVCRACGAPLVMRCPACETINVRTRSHCFRCQAALRGDAPDAGTPDRGRPVGIGDPRAPSPEAARAATEETDTEPMPYLVDTLPGTGSDAVPAREAGPTMDGPSLPRPPRQGDEPAERDWILSLRDAALPTSQLAAPRRDRGRAATRSCGPPSAAPTPEPPRPPAAELDWPALDASTPEYPTSAPPAPPSPAARNAPRAPRADASSAGSGAAPAGAAAGPAAVGSGALAAGAAALPASVREALGPKALAALDPALLAALAAQAPDRQRAKAERRAKVRQRQLRSQRRAIPDGQEAPIDVLVLEPQVESRATICMVLEGFGFHPRVALGSVDALTMARKRRYAAVLLGIGAQRDEVPELCQQLRALPGLADTPVFAIGDARHHTDRVRMQLAGAAETLLRPVDRGALARCLQAHAIALPRDPRLGGPPTA